MGWLLEVVLFLLPIPFTLKCITASKKTIQSWHWGKLVLVSLIIPGVALVYSVLLAGLITLLKEDTFFTSGFVLGFVLLAACTPVVLIRITWIWLSGENKE